MAQPWKHPKSGIWYFRRLVPEDLRRVIGKREWKVSLKTRDLVVARPRFAAESARCEEIFAAARDQLAGRPRVLASDAPKLADRWARSVADSWARDPKALRDFLHADDVESEGGSERIWFPASDLLDADDYRARSRAARSLFEPFLLEAGLPLPESTDPVFKALVEAFYGRWCDLCHVAGQRMHGDWVTSPHLIAADTPLSVEEAASSATPSLSKVLEAWADEKRLTDGDSRSVAKTISEFRTTVTRFIELNGDLPVAGISRQHVQDFRASLSRLPTKGAGLRGLTAPQLIAKAEEDGLPTARLTTVRKNLRALSTVLNFAKRRLGVIQEEPVSASGVIGQLSKSAQRAALTEESDKGYSWSELISIFQSPIYTQGWSPPRADYGEALFWLPLLLAYTGARREELAQLAAADVGWDEPSSIWYLSIRPGEGQTVKTLSSRRKVPLHDDLLALGFLDYWQSIPQQGRLFPKLTYHEGSGYGHNFGKLWSKYVKQQVGIQSGVSPSHGFRHAFKTICRDCGIPEFVHDWITGHAAQNVGATYGNNPLRRMAEELRKYPSLARCAGLLQG